MIAYKEKNKVAKVFENIHANLNSIEKQVESFDEKTNRFLDAILEVQRILTKNTNILNSVIPDFEKLTWIDSVDEDFLQQLKELLILANTVRLNLISAYIKLNDSKLKSGIKTALKEYKNTLDDYSEVIKDVNNVFFVFPNMPNIAEVTKKLLEV